MQTHDHGSAPDFLPHGFCYMWDPALLWTHMTADFFIGAAYVTIAVSLAWLVHSVRRDIPFSWAFVAFGLFIITCGMTHFMDIWTLWQPVYWLSGGVKVTTAVVSVATAIAMPFTVPRAVATVRDARIARERELAEVRAATLEEQNALLRDQAVELEQQRAEAQALASELEEANVALTAALGEARRSHELAERASEAKSVFLRTMSHELRTPLNAVIGYTQLIDMGTAGPVTSQQHDHLDRIGRSATHLLGLIDEVLTLTRDMAEGREVDLEDVPLREVVDDVAGMISPMAAARGLGFHVHDVPDLTIRTDAQWLKQILLNLTSNAVKFTNQGHIEVTAELSGDALLIHVADTGVGIAEAHMAKVFQPFWQVEQGTTRSQGGTGLGLSVSQELARRLGGAITMESSPGTGSTFTLRLPLGSQA